MRAAKQAGAFDDTYFVYADKRNIFDHPMPEGYDGTARPWYKQIAQAGAPVLTPAYVDASTGKLTITITFAEPVGPAGQPTGVVGTDMHLDTVTKKVAAIRPISKRFAFLIDGEGKLLAHPKAGLALKPASEIAKGVDAGMLTNGGRLWL